eukprot:2601016-Pleurochrysis_carterae.AAC.3
MFGAGAPISSGGGLFGGSGFGAPAPSTGGLFGAPTPAPASNSLFGAAPGGATPFGKRAARVDWKEPQR